MPNCAGAKLSWCQIVPVSNCRGAKLSRCQIVLQFNLSRGSKNKNKLCGSIWHSKIFQMKSTKIYLSRHTKKAHDHISGHPKKEYKHLLQTILKSIQNCSDIFWTLRPHLGLFECIFQTGYQKIMNPNLPDGPKSYRWQCHLNIFWPLGTPYIVRQLRSSSAQHINRIDVWQQFVVQICFHVKRPHVGMHAVEAHMAFHAGPITWLLTWSLMAWLA